MPKTDIFVRELIDKVAHGELLLPEMQRRYVWPATRVRDLLDSLYRGYPSGTILVWETDQDIETKALAVRATKSPTSSNRLLLLDGQQRITSLAAMLDMEKIVYFAVSVFWRGAVHQWTSLRSEAPDVHLCAYEEPIRQFLLGASALPDDVTLWVSVCPNGSVLNAMLVPWEAHLPECSRYLFYVSGLFFVLHFAHKLPQSYRTTCAYHCPDKIIWVSMEFENVIRQVLRDHAMSSDDSRVQKMLQEIAKIRSKP